MENISNKTIINQFSHIIFNHFPHPSSSMLILWSLTSYLTTDDYPLLIFQRTLYTILANLQHQHSHQYVFWIVLQTILIHIHCFPAQLTLYQLSIMHLQNIVYDRNHCFDLTSILPSPAITLFLCFSVLIHPHTVLHFSTATT